SFQVPTTCAGLTWTSISQWNRSSIRRSTPWSVKCSLGGYSRRRFVGHQRSARGAAAETPQASCSENNGQWIFTERSDASARVVPRPSPECLQNCGRLPRIPGDERERGSV